MIRLMIVDDMDEFCKHFEIIFKNEHDIEVVGSAGSKAEAVQLAEKLEPDVILMDIQMESDKAGIEATVDILKKNSNVKIVMLSVHSNRENVIESYENGAVGFIEKTASVAEVVNTVRNAVVMEKSNINKMLVSEYVKLKKEHESVIYLMTLLSKLSKNELNILYAVSKGKKYREIADEQNIEEVSVRTAASRICNKMGIKPVKEIVNTINNLGLDYILEKMIDKYKSEV